ncbi:MAG TPA: alpha/beta hydrolase [Acidobacteriaceae bacterium]|nr:alpha/beta hydrolase [Acidobacteriaceae bacterium]
MRTIALRVVCLALTLVAVASAQDVIPLYPGAAPGSPEATYPEQHYFSKSWNADVVTNVSKPTLTLFKPAADLKNGTAIVICPGGGYMALSIASEGTDLAKYLAAKGVTAFVLEYRVAHTEGDATEQFETLYRTDQAKFQQILKTAVPLAFADGMAAVQYVRAHAAQWGVSPDRVGIIGFSAGGGVTANVAFHYTPESRPAFVAPIYQGGFTPDTPPPADAPPMFIAAATDDTLGLAPASIAVYQAWVGAHKSAEIHMYAKGGHGFGMHKQNAPTDRWIDAFTDWLQFEGFLTPAQKP